ncbi:hypothetical protein MTR_4g097795 [Medicago truncatula]|uniref:Uncharacterized protein n=1 Tax=Medicago truncatula TaxID=3880 RepID=A0A072UPD0_MEDTR|nr:hypothetical protein MTR_4g097795 [Medicago truncatula]
MIKELRHLPILLHHVGTSSTTLIVFHWAANLSGSIVRWVELASRGERGEEVDSEVIIEDNGEATKDGVTQVAMTDEEHKMDVQRDWEGDGKGTI